MFRNNTKNSILVLALAFFAGTSHCSAQDLGGQGTPSDGETDSETLTGGVYASIVALPYINGLPNNSTNPQYTPGDHLLVLAAADCTVTDLEVDNFHFTMTGEAAIIETDSSGAETEYPLAAADTDQTVLPHVAPSHSETLSVRVIVGETFGGPTFSYRFTYLVHARSYDPFAHAFGNWFEVERDDLEVVNYHYVY